LFVTASASAAGSYWCPRPGLKMGARGDRKGKIEAVYVVLERVILRKLFPMPQGVAALFPSNSICRNEFSSLYWNFLLIFPRFFSWF
jgi:hypothetical protein